MQDFPQILKLSLSRDLPGKDVQWQMAPKDRLSEFPDKPGINTLNASVLILLYPYNNSIYTVFIQRQSYDGVHSGQISFPGGKVEPSDSSSIHTATREAEEEIGVNPSDISILGTLTPLFIPASNYLVTPVAGWIPSKPGFRPDPKEVEYLIYGDLRRLLDKKIIKTRPYEIRGRVIEIKYFEYENHMIWGATAMILQELLEILRTANIPEFRQAAS